MASVLHGSQRLVKIKGLALPQSIFLALRMTLDRDFVDVWAHPICCTAGMGDTLSREAIEENTTYHFAAWAKKVGLEGSSKQS